MSNVSFADMKRTAGPAAHRGLTVLLPEVLMTILPDHVWCKIPLLSVSEPGPLCRSALLAEQSRLLELRLVCKGFDKICTAENSLLIKACIRGNQARPHLRHSMQTYLRRHSSQFEQFWGFCDSACALEALDAMCCSKLKMAVFCETSQAVLSRLSCFSSITACELCLSDRSVYSTPAPALDLAVLQGLSDLQDLRLYGTTLKNFEALKQLTSLTISSSNVLSTHSCGCMTALRSVHMTDSVIHASVLLESLQTLLCADCKLFGASPAGAYCLSISHYMKLRESPETNFMKNLVTLSFTTDTSNWSDLSCMLQLTSLRSLQLA